MGLRKLNDSLHHSRGILATIDAISQKNDVIIRPRRNALKQGIEVRKATMDVAEDKGTSRQKNSFKKVRPKVSWVSPGESSQSLAPASGKAVFFHNRKPARKDDVTVVYPTPAQRGQHLLINTRLISDAINKL